MKSLFFYLVQVIVVSGILYGYYHVALRNKKFHQYNRFYILAATLASILIPFLNIPVYFTEDPSAQWIYALQNLSAEPVIISAEDFGEVEQPFNWHALLYSFYALIGLLGLVRIYISIRKLKKIMREHPAEHLNGIRFINTGEPGTPFSFFRWLFWNNKIELDSEKGEQIFRHEVFHIQQKHSLDTIFMEIVTIVFWINPFFHLMKKELKAIHEFLADRFATNETQKWEYAEMLLMQALNTQHQLVHPFFHNQIKRRIAMITNPHKTSHQYLRKMLVLPLTALLVTLFAFSYKQKQTPLQIEEVPLNNQFSMNGSLTDTLPNGNTIVADFKADVVSIAGKGFTSENQNIAPGLIIFNGKEYTKDDFSKFTGEKDRHVVIETRYLISTPANDEDAIAKFGAKAKDGVLEFKGATIDTTGPVKKPVTISLKNVQPDKEPLIVLNGVPQESVKYKSTLMKINPDNIKSIQVLKDSAARAAYGEKGNNGVLQIITKDHFNEVPDKSVPVQGVKEVTVVGYAKKDKYTTKADGVEEVPKPVEEVTVVGYATKKSDKNLELREITIDSFKASRKTVAGRPLEVVEVSRSANRVEVDPAFPGGASAWYAFIGKNIDGAAPGKNGAPDGEYTVFVRMKVSPEGRISDFKALTNHGYGMEQAAINALEKSPYWNPGYRNGVAVGSVKTQAFTFVVKNGKPAKLEEVTVVGRPTATVFPNPAGNNVAVKLNLSEDMEVTFRVMDMEGKERSRTKASVVKGASSTNIATADLAPGAYIIRMEGDRNFRTAAKFIKE